jgi:hypothetical protein
LRELINKKKFSFVQNTITKKKTKFLVQDSFILSNMNGTMMTTEPPQNVPRGANYTYDHNGKVIIVKKINPSGTTAARKDMQ